VARRKKNTILAQITLDLLESANDALRKAHDYLSRGKRGGAARYCVIAQRNLANVRQDIPAHGQPWSDRLTDEANRTSKILWRIAKEVLLCSGAEGKYTCELRRSFIVKKIDCNESNAAEARCTP